WAPASRAIARVRPITAPLEAMYVDSSPIPVQKVTDETLTIAPPPRASICGRTACARSWYPRTLTWKTWSNCSAVISCHSPSGSTPAWWTRTPAPPTASWARAATSAIAVGSDRSACAATASPPASVIALTVASSSSGCRPAATTLAPRCAKSSAVARPIPVAAPVTIAFLPAREDIAGCYPRGSGDPAAHEGRQLVDGDDQHEHDEDVG